MKRIIKAIASIFLFGILSISAAAIGDGNMDGGGGGNLGEGTSKNIWSEKNSQGNRREGMRVTIVHKDTKKQLGKIIDYTNTSTVTNSTSFPLSNVIHFGKKSKLDYKNGASLSQQVGGYEYIKTKSDKKLPSIIVTGGNAQAIENYFTDVNIVKNIAEDAGVNYDTLTNGNYKLLIEPLLFVVYEGYAYAMTPTELALLDKKFNGDIRSKLRPLTHNLHPFSLYLKTADLGFTAYKGSTSDGTYPNNDQIISNLGLGIVTFPPKLTNKIETSIQSITIKNADGTINSKSNPALIGEKVNVTVVYKNDSNKQTSFPYGFYQGSKKLAGAAKINLGTNGKTLTATYSVTVKERLETIRAEINYANRNNETNPNNNSKTTTVYAEKLETSIQSITIKNADGTVNTKSNPAIVGERVNVIVVYKNDSSNKTSFPYGFYQGSKKLAGAANANVGTGKTLIAVYGVTAEKAEQIIRAEINYANRFKETDPNNNDKMVTLYAISNETSVQDIIITNEQNNEKNTDVNIIYSDTEAKISVTFKNESKVQTEFKAEVWIGNSTATGKKIFDDFITIPINGTRKVNITYKVDGTETIVTARINYENKDDEINPNNNQKTSPIYTRVQKDGKGITQYTYPTDTWVITPITVYNQGGNITMYKPLEVSSFGYFGGMTLKDIVIPAGESQVVWIKWKTPAEECKTGLTFNISSGGSSAVFYDGEKREFVKSIDVYTEIKNDTAENTPPDPTVHDLPKNFDFSAANLDNANNKLSESNVISSNSWTVWCIEYTQIDETTAEYEYFQREYRSELVIDELKLVPSRRNPTAYEKSYNTYMKSGYGVELQASTMIKTIIIDRRTNKIVSQVNSYEPSADDNSVVAVSQSARTYFPEFSFQLYDRLLKQVDGNFTFKNNIYSMFTDPVHFTPIWYPDTPEFDNDNLGYRVYTKFYHAYTPAGELKANGYSNKLYIEGNVYDDWHVGPVGVE